MSDGGQVHSLQNRRLVLHICHGSEIEVFGTLARLCSFRESQSLPELDGNVYMLLGLQSGLSLINQGNIPWWVVELRFYLAMGPDVDIQTTSQGLSVSSQKGFCHLKLFSVYLGWAQILPVATKAVLNEPRVML